MPTSLEKAPVEYGYLTTGVVPWAYILDRWDKARSGWSSLEGVFTLNRGLVTNVVDLVNHEIYLERILLEVGKPVWDLFGKNLAKLNAFDPPIEKSDKD